MRATSALLWLLLGFSGASVEPRRNDSTSSNPHSSQSIKQQFSSQELPKLSKHRPQPMLSRNHIELLSWVVEVQFDPARHSQQHLDEVADAVARASGLVNRGQIGLLRGLYQLDHRLHSDHFHANVLLTHDKEKTQTVSSLIFLPDHWSFKEINSTQWDSHRNVVLNHLESNPDVVWYKQLHAFHRRKRALTFEDPAFPQQWHLQNTKYHRQDLNITGVWERNITGKGVVTAVVDDGLEWNNPDILPNYHAEASYDLNNNDRDPMPSSKDSKNHHGTRCAGEIAAAANSVCAVGVAYQSRIAGLKVLDGPMTDSLEGVAFTKAKDLIDVYSCSWGPDDDGKTVDGPHYIALRALREAVDYGRRGYGSIFVVASGNGGTVGDNCNFDGYANSIYTVTIGAVDELGNMPYYAEECASMLAVTFSSGSGLLRSIVTTDWQKQGGTGCTVGHTGTSAAAPLAAGMIALMLQARPCLTWRDVQHIIVMAAVKVDIDMAHWTRNKAGFHHSHKHGYGLMSAWRLVNAAKTWHPVPWMTLYSTEELTENAPIPDNKHKLMLTYTVTKEMLDGYNLFTLEYVHAIVTLEHAHRGSLEIRLQCPSRTGSVLAATRDTDNSADGFDRWTFSTVRCWGEPPEGDWVLTVQDKGKHAKTSRGVFRKWQLKLYGSAMSPEDIAERRTNVLKAASGEHLHDNFSLPCPPPPLRNKPVSVISEKNLKIVVLVSAFCMVMAVYESLEYLFCYDDEKKKHKEEMAALAEQRGSEGQSETAASSSSSNSQISASLSQNISNTDDASEATRLLVSEEIPMEDLTPIRESNNQNSIDEITPPSNGCAAVGVVQAKPGDKKGFLNNIKHIMSHIFHKQPRHYKALTDSDLTPLTEDISEEVVFDVTDINLGSGESQNIERDIDFGTGICSNYNSDLISEEPSIQLMKDVDNLPNMTAPDGIPKDGIDATGCATATSDVSNIVPNGSSYGNTFSNGSLNVASTELGSFPESK